MPGVIADIPTRRQISIAAVAVAVLVLAAWLALTWDAYVTNFQVRWMCDEDRPFVLLRRDGVEALAIPDDVLERDARALTAYAEVYPVVAAASTPEGRGATYALVELWPKRVRTYWNHAVLRTELSVVERRASTRVLGTSSLYRRVALESAPWAALRASLAPPPESCTVTDRIEFVKRVLRPPA